MLDSLCSTIHNTEMYHWCKAKCGWNSAYSLLKRHGVSITSGYPTAYPMLWLQQTSHGIPWSGAHKKSSGSWPLEGIITPHRNLPGRVPILSATPSCYCSCSLSWSLRIPPWGWTVRTATVLTFQVNDYVPFVHYEWFMLHISPS